MYDNGEPYDNTIGSREIKHQNIGTDAELDQGHAIKIEELAEP